MTTQTIEKEFGFQRISAKQAEDRPITSVNACDLLSWVMANGKVNQAWITVQTHGNILAVASLLDMSCIIIPEGIDVDQAVIAKADQEEIAIFRSELSVYQIFSRFYEAGLRA